MLKENEKNWQPRNLYRVVGGTNGVKASRWRENAATHGPTGTLFSDCTTHVNGAPDEVVTVANLNLTDLDFPATGSDFGTSQELYETYVYFPVTTVLSDNNGNTGEWLKAFLGSGCGQKPQPIAETGNTNTANRDLGIFYTVSAGLYKFVGQVSDFSVYGGLNIRESVDGGATFTAIPTTRLWADSANIECVPVECCFDTGEIRGKDGNAITFDESLMSWCEIRCPEIAEEPLPDIEFLARSVCVDIDGDPANYVTVTQEIVVTNGDKEVTLYENYGIDDQQSEYELPDGAILVDCATGVPIEDPPIVVDCSDWEIVTVYDAVGTNGVNVERWNTNAITGEPTTTVPSDIFVGAVDYSGMPSHDNGVPDGPIVVEDDLLVLDQVNDQSQMRLWTYLYTIEPIRLRELYNRAESVDYFLGECCGTPAKVATGVYPNTVASGASFDVSLPAGIHYIGAEVFDFSAYSGVNYQYSVDNGLTWAKVPKEWLYTAKPRVTECQKKVCPETDLIAEIGTGILNTTATLCAPSLCGSVALPNKQYELKTYYKVEPQSENGVMARHWRSPLINSGNAAPHDNVSNIFVDSAGNPNWRTHINGDADYEEIINTWSVADSSLVGNIDANGQDQMLVYAYVLVTEQMTLYEDNANSGERVGVYIGECCSYPPELVLETTTDTTGGTGSGLGEFATLGAGLHLLAFQMSDFSAFGGLRLRFSTDLGETLQTFDASFSYPIKPKINVPIKVWVCEDGTVFNQDRTETIEVDNVTIFCEPISCTKSQDSTGTLTIV